MTLRSFVFLLYVAMAMASPSSARMGKDLSDPVVHGAWLYQANCLRCHGPYDKERLGEGYAPYEKLESAVAEKGCRIVWAKNLGSSLTGEEITALCHYIVAREKGDKEPELQESPRIPAAVAEPFPSELPATVAVMAKAGNPALSPPLAKLVAKNPVANGGWLYTQNCYRCHLTYDQTRQGRGMSPESLRKIVENGKTSTQMSGFGVLAGGKLKNSEIEAILSYITTWEHMSSPPAIARELLIPPASDPAALHSLGLPRFPPVQGDERVGRVLYLMNCSRCHNPDRSGYIGRRLLPPWECMRPDIFLKATLKSGIPGSLMPAFATSASGRLRPKEIDDVISFLLTEPAK